MVTVAAAAWLLWAQARAWRAYGLQDYETRWWLLFVVLAIAGFVVPHRLDRKAAGNRPAPSGVVPPAPGWTPRRLRT